MNKIFKTILIILALAPFAVGFLFALPANAQIDELIVEYWTGTEWKLLTGSLFNEANFLPGEAVTRSVKVTNDSNLPQLIAIQALNVSNPIINIGSPARLGDVLILEIKENGVRRYKNDLSRFFSAGEITLSDSKLAGKGAQAQYDFIVTFYAGANNPFQGKSLGFDILVGFQGEEGGLPPGGGSNGPPGGLPPGLSIYNESVA
ncbi:hypothetical protein KKA18_02995, partial [Patescibacteria group bacterium]|nr:hypothetical protein [Patescibacteria group bacterium]